MRQKNHPFKRKPNPKVKSFSGLPKGEATVANTSEKQPVAVKDVPPPVVNNNRKIASPSHTYLQCFNCQRYGHHSSVCVQATRCVICSGPHRAKECQKPPEEKPFCALCGGPHTSSYRGCCNAPKRRRSRGRRCRHPKLSAFILTALKLITKGDFLSKEQIARVREEMQPATPKEKTDPQNNETQAPPPAETMPFFSEGDSAPELDVMQITPDEHIPKEKIATSTDSPTGAKMTSELEDEARSPAPSENTKNIEEMIADLKTHNPAFAKFCNDFHLSGTFSSK